MIDENEWEPSEFQQFVTAVLEVYEDRELLTIEQKETLQGLHQSIREKLGTAYGLDWLSTETDRCFMDEFQKFQEDN